MTDLLSKRIISAKRELTALKTAHKRGLGNIKIYKYVYDFSSTGINIGTMSVTVNFNQSFSEYPFAYLVGYEPSQQLLYASSMDAQEIVYFNNGYSVKFTGPAICYPTAIEPKVNIYSTAPVSSVSHVWED